jgi:hypothetical protein
MGPNLYVTPPGSYTKFHLDGNGTVDSEHLCLSGFNEIIMLRRLSEYHTLQAFTILTGEDPQELFQMAHEDKGKEEVFQWPNKEQIEKCKKLK